ncbi:MAG: nucleotidyltransferase domain-containing protein [bacterium]
MIDKGVKRIAVFGSFMNGLLNKNSNIDILVEF